VVVGSREGSRLYRVELLDKRQDRGATGYGGKIGTVDLEVQAGNKENNRGGVGSRRRGREENRLSASQTTLASEGASKHAGKADGKAGHGVRMPNISRSKNLVETRDNGRTGIGRCSFAVFSLTGPQGKADEADRTDGGGKSRETRPASTV
jgi:hypothetical protein